MFSIRNLNIRDKLIAIIMLASSAAVLMAGSIFISFAAYIHRTNLARDTASLAEVIGNNCKVILEFKVYEDAQKVLSTLSARDSIVFASLYDASGEVISTYRRHVPGDILQQQDTKDNSHVFANGILHVFYNVRVNEMVIGTVYLQDDMSRVYQNIKREASILIFIVLVALAASYILSSRLQGMISRPILSLAGIAGTISEEKDYSLRAQKESNDEVGQLIESFNEMLEQIQQRDDALRESEERFELALRGADLGLWDWDIVTGHVIFNRRWAEMLGYSVEEIEPSIKGWEKMLHQDDVLRVRATLKDNFDGKETFDEAEYRLKTKAGGWKWILAHGMIVGRDTAGNPLRSVGTHLDITERKEAIDKIEASLREKEVLLKEIHHRVKNNMQVIISLLRLQSEQVTDKQYLDMFKESQDRIRSMALVHEKLYQTKNLADVDFKRYVKSLVTSLFRSYGTRPDKIALNIEVEDVSLGLESAIPCGLIINELVSNSLKYAFPEERKGGVRVALNSINGDELVLEVSDNGIGISEELDVRNAESMGLHLVTILSEDQLHGKIELSRTGGTNFHVRFKKHTYKARI